MSIFGDDIFKGGGGKGISPIAEVDISSMAPLTSLDILDIFEPGKSYSITAENVEVDQNTGTFHRMAFQLTDSGGNPLSGYNLFREQIDAAAAPNYNLNGLTNRTIFEHGELFYKGAQSTYIYKPATNGITFINSSIVIENQSGLIVRERAAGNKEVAGVHTGIRLFSSGNRNLITGIVRVWEDAPFGL